MSDDTVADRCAFGLIAVFIVTGLWLSQGKDLWLDELFTWYQVRDKSFGALLRATDTGFNLLPAGHFILLWGLNAMGLLTATTARLVSLSAITGAFVVVWRLWRQWWSPSIALMLIAVLVGSSFPLLVYAIEVRPYALSFLFAALALRTTCRLSENPHHRGELLLNGIYAFALPFLSYPASFYAMSLLIALIAAAVIRKQHLPLAAIGSSLAGWTLFALVSGRTVLRQITHNPVVIGNASPRLSDLLHIYPSLVSLPLGLIVVLGFSHLVSSQTDKRPDATFVARPISAMALCSQLLWLLVPVSLLVLAKIAHLTIWGERFILPTAIALASLAGVLLAPLPTIRWRRGLLLAISGMALISLAANALSLARANRDATVRRFAATFASRLENQTVIVAELNTYFHLLHYASPSIDLRLFSATAENKSVLTCVNSHLHAVDRDDLLHLPRFVLLVDANSGWALQLREQFAAHGLRVKRNEPVSNEFVHEIWWVEAVSRSGF